MDINEIKQVPIVDFLYILGIEPVKHKASGLWYHAPYRNDRNPSLRVSTDKNVWYDYGIARGGDIFNLAGEFINSNEFVAQAKFISETLGGSFPTSFPHHQRIAEKAVKAKGNPFSDIVEKPLSHPALRQYLRERGISAVRWNTDTMANSSLLSVSRTTAMATRYATASSKVACRQRTSLSLAGTATSAICTRVLWISSLP
jgi:DNA primase